MSGLSEVCRNAGVSWADAKNIFAAIVTMLGAENGETVKIQGFGSFRVFVVPGRTVKSSVINGGVETEIKPALGIKFKASPLSKRRVNMAARRKSRDETTGKRLIDSPPRFAAKPSLPPPEPGKREQPEALAEYARVKKAKSKR